MYDYLKAGEEVSFPGLLDIRLIVEEVCESGVRCKYYDDHLNKYIKLTFPSDALIRTGKQTTPPASRKVPRP
jgi:hypothetical protein